VDFEFPKVMQRWSRPLYSQELSNQKHSSGCLNAELTKVAAVLATACSCSARRSTGSRKRGRHAKN
jgi:hypothetical protein